MPEQTPATPTNDTGTGTATPPAATGEQTATGGAEPTGTPAVPAPDPANEQRVTEATQRADEAAAERDELRAALDAVNKALNPDATEGEQDPKALATAVADRDKQITDLSAQLRTVQVELAAHRAADEQGARADRLLNSRSFLAAVAELDPTDAKFGDDLTTAIKTAVDGDPDLYRAAPSGPARGGAEISGAPSGERRPASLHDAIAARFGG